MYGPSRGELQATSAFARAPSASEMSPLAPARTAKMGRVR